jgi:predicted RNA-binding protein YlxR (DUF448 family)
MSKRPKRRKHIPQRTCVACRTARPKRELVRIVRAPEGTVVVDETGKRSGRGAYLCRQSDCWEKALARRQLEQALNVTLTSEIKSGLREYAAELPRFLMTKSEEDEAAGKGAVGDE